MTDSDIIVADQKPSGVRASLGRGVFLLIEGILLGQVSTGWIHKPIQLTMERCQTNLKSALWVISIYLGRQSATLLQEDKGPHVTAEQK